MRTPWRGFLVLASWTVWPVVYFLGYWIFSMMVGAGRRCSIEGCDAPEGLLGGLWLLAMLIVPVIVTYKWIQWRRSAR